MYTEAFTIKDGSLAAADVDDKLALSFVMPGCMILLSDISPSKRCDLENDDVPADQIPYIVTDSKKLFRGLRTGETYYACVEENSEQKRKDQEKMRHKLAAARAELDKKSGKRQEGCSCLFGNPCSDKYICKDWHNRFAVARKNGWKEF